MYIFVFLLPFVLFFSFLVLIFYDLFCYMLLEINLFVKKWPLWILTAANQLHWCGIRKEIHEGSGKYHKCSEWNSRKPVIFFAYQEHEVDSYIILEKVKLDLCFYMEGPYMYVCLYSSVRIYSKCTVSLRSFISGLPAAIYMELTARTQSKVLSPLSGIEIVNCCQELRLHWHPL